MSNQIQKTPEEKAPEQHREERPESPAPPQKKVFRIILVQTLVFAAVFFTIIWLVEDQPLIAVALGIACIVYIFAGKKIR